ncbi:uncharacterized protein LOC121986894 [Zingiber officinale]|uniref:uncharacterized protein LOC121986894 n=1 Tax=Zingiber officinale TaxID=94328 RepID=UPI001C4C265B|nr:uncharacterized protein LOC121986894 [Zingiber officinale]
MQIDVSEIQPVATSLYGFISNERASSEDAEKHFHSVGFIVLVQRYPRETDTACVLGGSLHDQVREVRGEQLVSRRCYIDMVRVEARKAQRTQDGEIHVIQEEPLPIAEELIPREEVQLYPECPESITSISGDLSIKITTDLIKCLTYNRHVFAWSLKELLGVKPKVAEHKLHLLPDARPVKQKKWNFSAEQNKIIRAELDQLLKVGHIREVQFSSWLSNVVLVSKPNNKWRVCINFRGLNRANPKDCYPLPRIDQMMDSTSGCERICMLDAYQGYHEIPLALEDQ